MTNEQQHVGMRSAPSSPVVNEDSVFKVGRIFCVGRNYADHAKEMGSDPDREPPFFFMKMTDALVPGGGDVAYPPSTANLQHEVELVVAVGLGGSSISPQSAVDHIYGFAVGLDLTRRDLQSDAKKHGRPWDFGKSFEQAAPISEITKISDCGLMNEGAISLAVNSEIKQIGDLKDMIWSTPEIIAYLSDYYRLYPGDLIFTGTPAGVGRIERGDNLVARIDGLSDLAIRITD